MDKALAFSKKYFILICLVGFVLAVSVTFGAPGWILIPASAILTWVAIVSFLT